MKVGLYVTCLVDLFRPSVGFAMLKLLEEAGHEVVVPTEQSCCGQPAYNSGARLPARAAMERIINVFEDCDAVVVPSGSCASMIRTHGPGLFEDASSQMERARNLAERCFEATQFFVDILGMSSLPRPARSRIYSVAYHDSCSGLRELGIEAQPRLLLGAIGNIRLVPLSEAQRCCGFGGAFCVKYPEISDHMTTEKAVCVEKTGADCVLAGDLGCLLNIAGKLKRRRSPIEARHVIEVLAGFEEDHPSIGARP